MSGSAGAAVDAARCPLCAGPNLCAMEAARAAGSEPPPHCWCMDSSFGRELLERVPAAERRLACVCAGCAAAGSGAAGSGTGPG